MFCQYLVVLDEIRGMGEFGYGVEVYEEREVSGKSEIV
jgi:hypothetical protein